MCAGSLKHASYLDIAAPACHILHGGGKIPQRSLLSTWRAPCLLIMGFRAGWIANGWMLQELLEARQVFWMFKQQVARRRMVHS